MLSDWQHSETNGRFSAQPTRERQSRVTMGGLSAVSGRHASGSIDMGVVPGGNARLSRLAARVRLMYKLRQRELFLLVVVSELLYVFLSVPLRLGFFFDPYAQANKWTDGWSRALTVFTACDLLAELAAFASFRDIFAARRRALAARAANAGGFLALRHRGPVTGNRRTVGATNGRALESPRTLVKEVKSSMLVAWSLNTILPTTNLAQSIRQPLILESMSMVPVELLCFVFSPNALHVLRCLKLLRLYRIPNCLREIKMLLIRTKIVQTIEYTGNALLFRTLIRGLGLCHCLACGYMLIAHVECGIDFHLCLKASTSRTPGIGREHHYTCWAIEDQLVGTGTLRQYARALYWASRTLVTLGYYDVAAVTAVETTYAVIAQIIGAVFSTSVVATFMFIFRYRNSREQEFMTHVDNAKEFMAMHRFPAEMREAVLAFYTNMWTAHRGLQKDAAVEILPEHLRVSVYSVIKVQRIQSVSFLAKESIEFVNTLALDLVFCVFSPKDWVIEKIPHGMFFMLRGNVQLKSNQSPPRTVKSGEHFAEFCLLYPGKQDDVARAQTFCELYMLPGLSFRKTLAIFYRDKAPQELERMQQMQSRRDQQEQKMKRMLGQSASVSFRGTSILLTGDTSRDRFVHLLFRQWQMPGSLFRKIWSHVRFLGLVCIAYEVPYFAVFDSATLWFGNSPAINAWAVVSVVFELFFMADFAMRARYFAFIDTVVMIPVHDSTFIFQAYRKQGMWVDLISIVPVALVLQFIDSPSFSVIGPMFRLLRLVRLKYLEQTIHDLAHIHSLSSKMQGALTLLLAVTLTMHIVGCLWFLMARFSITEADLGLHSDSLTRSDCLYYAGIHSNCSWAIFDAYGQIETKFRAQDGTSAYNARFAYIRSIYWSIVALTTVGYGDIVAFSTAESFFAAFWAFIGAVINYGVVGAMSNIISHLTAASRHHTEKMNSTNLVLAHFGVSENLRTQIRRYYHQQLYVQKVSSEAKLLEHLPHRLRHQISMSLHAESVQRVPLFVELENDRLLQDLTGLFRHRIHQRGDAFFPENGMCDEMFVIITGRVNVFSKYLPSIPVGALSDGDCYGVCEMILRKKYPTTLLAASVVEASVISVHAFVTMIESRFPNDGAVLQLRATEQRELDMICLESVIDNLKNQSVMMKYTDGCRSMFAEIESFAHQEHKTRMHFYWDLVVFLLNIYNAFQITFRICFLAHPSSKTREVLVLSDFWGDALLFIDIYLKLYYFDCECGLSNLISREERNHYYAQNWLKCDLYSCAPLYYVGHDFLAMSLCRIPRLIRMVQVSESMDSLIMRFQQRFSSGGNISAYLSPFKLVLVLLFAAHFAGCVFFLISETDHHDRAWIYNDHVVEQEHESTAVLYLRSFYWALTTLTLVGSKEIVPLGTAGTLWAALTCLSCVFIVGHIVGELSELILEMDKSKKKLKEREVSFEEFAKEENLPTSLRTRVAHYFKYQHEHLKGMDINSILRDLSPNLRVDLMMDLHGSTIRTLTFVRFLNQAQVNTLVVQLKSELFIPGDTIIVEGDLGHKLYIIKTGMAVVLWKSTSSAVASLLPGSVFGEVAFFLQGQRRIASVQADKCSEVLVLNWRSWEYIMQMNTAQDRKATENAILDWVRCCLKGYNVMTVETVKDIKYGSCMSSRVPALQSSGPSQKVLASASTQRKPAKRAKAPPVKSKSLGMTNFVQALFRQKTGAFLNLGRVHAANESGSSRPFSPREVDLKGARPSLLSPRSLRMLKSLTLPLLKLSSFKNGTSIQLHPVNEIYSRKELDDMEEECWRRYKVSLLMAGLFPDGIESIQTDLKKSTAPEPDFKEPPKVGKRIRKTIVGDSRRNAARLSIMTDGKRFLDNYATKRTETARLVRSASASHFSDLPAPTPIKKWRRNRMLKRSQSLPVFDRHFVRMIEAELKASSATDYESKLNVGREVLERCQRPEFAYLFQLYVSWCGKMVSKTTDKRVHAVKSPTSENLPDRSRMISMASVSNLLTRNVSLVSHKRLCMDSEEARAEDFLELVQLCFRSWEFCSIVVAIFYALYIPYLVCFRSDAETTEDHSSGFSWGTLAGCLDLFCIMDLALKRSVFRGVLRMLNEVEDLMPLREGAKPCISLASIVDVVATVPIDVLMLAPYVYKRAGTKWLYYLALFQINKMVRILEAMTASERITQFLAEDLRLPVSESSVRLVRSISGYVILGHWIGCLWFRASLYAHEHYHMSWLTANRMLPIDQYTDMHEISYFRRYIRSIHFAAGSITTVFYGDIASLNVVEVVVELCVIVVCIFIFGSLVGAQSERIDAVYRRRMLFEQNLSELYYFVETNDVPRDIRNRLKLYYTNTWIKYHGHDKRDDVDGLSTLLAEDIAQFTMLGFASKVSILQTCDQGFLRALLSCLKQVICSPNEAIVRKGDVNRSMYFIARGKILVRGPGFELIKEEGDFFGELSLLYGIPRSATCSSLGISLLYVLEWEAYELLLEQYPEYREQNRREWVLVSTVLNHGESRFQSIVSLVARMEQENWVRMDEIIRKAKTLK